MSLAAVRNIDCVRPEKSLVYIIMLLTALHLPLSLSLRGVISNKIEKGVAFE